MDTPYLPHSPSLFRWRGLLPLILLLAFALRLYQLTDIPPGLTHDEANHGREAIGVLQGDWRYFFPYNYGSEPIYSYTVAGTMAAIGENGLALRLVNVWFGVLALALATRWARRAFDEPTALLLAALLAVSFWPLASSRQALRAGMLPFFMTAVVYFFWVFLPWRRAVAWPSWLAVGLFALSLAATWHIYLAARVTWLLFPLFVAYLAWGGREAFRRAWRPTGWGLLVTAVLVTPLLVYLRQHPEVQPRLGMLNAPLQAVQSGDLLPVLRNGWEAFLAFIWPGYGDQFLAYNIPGRPVFDPVTAVLFLLGLLITIYHTFRPATRFSFAFLLFWFLTGILPSLVTGPTANTTRNLAALPAVYLLPVVGFVAGANWLAWRWPRLRAWIPGLALLWLGVAGGSSLGDYWGRWGESPEVRGAYQHTLVAMLQDAALVADGRGPEALGERVTAVPPLLSTVYPGPAHDPSIALVLAPQLDLRWSDARLGLIFPGGQATTALLSQATPPHAAFAPWLRPLRTVTLRPDDLDPAFTWYALSLPPADWLDEVPAPVNFANALTLLHAEWWETAVPPGHTAALLTVWRITDPTQVGPLVPPADTTDVVLFTQILAAGSPLAQHDSLAAPSWDWQAGDIVVQIHPIPIPASTPPGAYPVITGVYDRLSGVRLPVLDMAGQVIESFASVSALEILP